MKLYQGKPQSLCEITITLLNELTLESRPLFVIKKPQTKPRLNIPYSFSHIDFYCESFWLSQDGCLAQSFLVRILLPSTAPIIFVSTN